MDEILVILSCVIVVCIGTDIIYLCFVAQINRVEDKYSKIQIIFATVICVMFVILTVLTIVSGDNPVNIIMFALNAVLWAVCIIKEIATLKNRKKKMHDLDNQSKINSTSKDTGGVDLTKK